MSNRAHGCVHWQFFFLSFNWFANAKKKMGSFFDAGSFVQKLNRRMTVVQNVLRGGTTFQKYLFICSKV